MGLLIDQLAAYLHTQGEGTVGTDLFSLHRPSSPLACVSLHATGGYPPDGYTEREHPTVMLFAGRRHRMRRCGRLTASIASCTASRTSTLAEGFGH